MNKLKGSLLIGLGILVLSGAYNSHVVGARDGGQNVEQYGTDDLSSLGKSNVQRTTELGKTVVTKKKGEFDILLSDPALAQKYDINLTQTKDAWLRHRAVGSKDVRVCIIDTGIDVNHPDIKDNLWVNEGETGKDRLGRDKRTNGVDDDNDGYVDNVHGFNFVSNNSDLSDNHGHGTHIAGIIGAKAGNGIGAAGIAPNVSLIIAKYYDPTAPGANNLINTVRAIRFCVEKEAHIINYSGGGLEPSEKEREAIALARDKGILFVAAAGNEKSNSDVKKYYPADYDLDNIISVTAIDREKNVLPSSNYGQSSVDIAAPGKDNYSTLPGGKYGHMTGTSQATAVVTGVAVLLKGKFPDFDAARIARHITETGDLEPIKLAGKTRNQKILNAYRALAILDQGVTITGAIAKDSGYMDSQKFTIGRDLSNDGSSSAVSPSSLLGFGEDLRKLMNEHEAARAR